MPASASAPPTPSGGPKIARTLACDVPSLTRDIARRKVRRCFIRLSVCCPRSLEIESGRGLLTPKLDRDREALGSWMGLVVGFFEAVGGDVGVDLGGDEMGVAQEFLDAAEV